MMPKNLTARIYIALSRRKKKVFLTMLLFLAACAAVVSHIRVQEDIGMILPTGDPQLSHSLELMQLAPFSGIVFINLERDASIPLSQLLDAADAVRDALPQQFFSGTLASDEIPSPAALAALLPSLADRQLTDNLQTAMSPEALDDRMHKAVASLSSFSGIITKKYTRQDPFGLLAPLYARLSAFRLIPDANIQRGYPLLSNGSQLLLLAKSRVAATDSGNAILMLDSLDGVLRDMLPDGIRATVFCGHQFAVANANTIKKDLTTVMGASTLGIVLIFIAFVRRKDALWVVAVPGIVLLVSAAALTLLVPVVSGITLGFGAILLGISIDFSLHVYYALRCNSASPDETLQAISRPVLYGGATSLGAFGALAISSMPGIVQLSFFGIVGLCCGIVLALFILPLCMKRFSYDTGSATCAESRKWRLIPCVLVAATLTAAFMYGGAARVDNNLRNLSVFPAKLHRAEMHIRSTWGNAHESAILFAESRDFDKALLHAAAVRQTLEKVALAERVMSLPTIIPPAEEQQFNRNNWGAFVDSNAQTIRSALERAKTDYGFTEAAFLPFESWLQSQPAPIDPAHLANAGLSNLVSLLHTEHNGMHYVLTLLPDSPALQSFALTHTWPEGVTLYSPKVLGHKLGEAIEADFKGFVLVSFAVMAVLMFMCFRHAGFAILAMVPLFTGLAVLLCAMRATGTPFNLFSVAALPLIIGLAADYGIFMVSACTLGCDHGTRMSVLVSGLTTIAGFGALALAHHPAMHALGITVLLGIGTAIPAALYLIPVLYGRAQ
jgi:predicted exporter